MMKNNLVLAHPTPGLWRVKHDGHQWVIRAKGYDIGGICDDPAFGRPLEDPANAHLMAAAPLMLRTLERFVKLRKGDLGPDLAPLERAIIFATQPLWVKP
jgi:hypothetical protein